MLSKTWHSAALSAMSVHMLTPGGQGCPSILGARNVPGTALFDFGDVELEEVVQPGDEFLSVHVLRSASGRDEGVCADGRSLTPRARCLP